MKLIHYTFRNLWGPLLILFVAWGVAFYSMVVHELNDETNDSLANYKEIIIRSALADSTLLKDHVDLMTRYFIREVPEQQARLNRDIYYDSTVYIEMEGEDEPVRVLQTYFMTANHRYYELRIMMSTLEKEDMVETILLGMAILYLFLGFCLLLVFHFVFHRSFKPLYRLLDWLKHFHVGATFQPIDNPTPIEEFVVLNQAVQESSRRSIEIYNRQKQFVENAAHELQTPLAVCMNKLELLGEDADCTERQLGEIADLHRSLSGIIRLNRSLLLLSRIDNGQYTQVQRVELKPLLQEVVEDMEMIYDSKDIQVEWKAEEDLVCFMDPSLATTFVRNLVKNAFVHNKVAGSVYIYMYRDALVVANTSECGALNQEILFTRFARQSDAKGSTGLGLAIVKSIADLYRIQVSYAYDGHLHQFKLTFQ